MQWKELILNSLLAAGWYALGQLELVEAQWALLAVPAIRFVLGFLASKVGAPIPVDR